MCTCKCTMIPILSVHVHVLRPLSVTQAQLLASCATGDLFCICNVSNEVQELQELCDLHVHVHCGL